jgi:hypothetical protein
MSIVAEMSTSFQDAKWFHERIDEIVRGPQHGHDLAVIRRYFRAYLHCWKTVLHFVRKAKGFGGAERKDDWIAWCKRWQGAQLEPPIRPLMDQLRETRDYDTHSGTIVVSGEVAAGLFPLVFVGPVKVSHTRRELVACTGQGLEILDRLIATHATTP